MINKLSIYRCLFVCLISNSGSVVAQNLDDAVNAMRSGDFAEAYCIMRPLAENGDADAQYNIGWMYMNGYGLRVNDNLALNWWMKASEQGHREASFSIGMLYNLGEGNVAKDSVKTIDFYLLAADEGHEDAVAILKSMMVRNDSAILERLHSITNGRESLFGVKRLVNAKKLNARKGPSTKTSVIAKLLKDEAVLELKKQGRWSQVVLPVDKKIDRTVWVYNPLLVD